MRTDGKNGDLNAVCISGVVGDRLTYSQKNKPHTMHFSLIVRRANYLNKDEFSCVAYGDTADWIKQWGTPGTRIIATGRIQSFGRVDNLTVYLVIERAMFVEGRGAATQTNPLGYNPSVNVKDEFI